MRRYGAAAKGKLLATSASAQHTPERDVEENSYAGGDAGGGGRATAGGDAGSGGRATAGKGRGTVRVKTSKNSDEVAGAAAGRAAMQVKGNVDGDADEEDEEDLDVPLSRRRCAVQAAGCCEGAGAGADVRSHPSVHDGLGHCKDQARSHVAGAKVRERSDLCEGVSVEDATEEGGQESQDMAKWRYEGHKWIGKRVR